MIEYQEYNSSKKDYHDIRMWFNFTYPPHMHKSMEFVYLIEGELFLTVEGREEQMHTGQMALIFSNQIHSFSNIDKAVAFIQVFSPDVVEQFIRLIGSKNGISSVFNCSNNTGCYIDLCIKKMIKDIKPDNRKEGSYCIDLYNSDSITEDTLNMTSYLYAVCEQYLRFIPLTDTILHNNNITHKIITYITEHFTDNITLNEVSDILGYEKHYISRCFNKMIGINLKQFVNMYRISYAKHLLSDLSKSIADIAMQCGFQSIRNFNRFFKDTEGKTPNEFRRLLLNNLNFAEK